MRGTIFGLAFLLGVVLPSRAELVELTFHKREPFAEGAAFGNVGPYEKLTGVARFAVDPNHPPNRLVIDIGKAPRNAAGRQEKGSG